MAKQVIDRHSKAILFIPSESEKQVSQLKKDLQKQIAEVKNLKAEIQQQLKILKK